MPELSIQVQVFAVLKDYFPEDITLQLSANSTVSDAITALGKKNPGARELLSASRGAIDDEFVPASQALNEKDLLLILPPASGG